ncbi:MAG: glycosyltransferase family 2 protein [Planctomycetes bacterium]|nr:glycosyltransferase family 2 protein [Planctomycetota bacterium]
MSSTVEISVVVPVFDEEPNLPILHAEIASALNGMRVPWEVLYVDDRSSDGSLRAMLALRAEDPHVRVLQFRGRSGQTAALAAGFDHARGAIVVTLDGDLQNDPADIPKLVEELERGFDIVAGWRKARRDGFVLRKLPSRVANRLIAWVTGVQIHDTGCTLKAFRRELVEKLPIYAEQHRFLPAMSAGSGARVSEVVVNHRPRRFGRSKYGISRMFRVLLDLLVIKMVTAFGQRPLVYFGMLTLPFLFAFVVFVCDVLWHWESVSFANEWGRAVLIVYMLVSMLCIYFVGLGLVAELAVKASGMHGRRVRRVITTSLEPLSR